MAKVRKGAESFLLEGSSTKGVLLIHGFTGTPSEMRPMGEFLNERGFTVLAVRLKGHGTVPEDMEECTFEDWREDVAKGFEELSEHCGEVFAAGLSMGALLALCTAKLGAKKLILMSMPVFLQDERAYGTIGYTGDIRMLPKEIKRPRPLEEYRLGYDAIPVRAVPQVLKGIEEAKRTLPCVKVPCLVAQSVKDDTVKPGSADYIFDHLGTKEGQKRLLRLGAPGHIVTLGDAREELFQKSADFLEDAS